MTDIRELCSQCQREFSPLSSERSDDADICIDCQLKTGTKAIPFKWESIDSEHQRAKVFGGWLVKAHEEVFHDRGHTQMVSGWDWRIAMAFVPDPMHQWQIKK